MNAKDEETRISTIRSVLHEDFPHFLDLADQCLRENGGRFVAGPKVNKKCQQNANFI